MKERPILFSGAMVKAILEGRKSQTRRIVKNTFAKRLGYATDFYRGDKWSLGVHPYGGFWATDGVDPRPSDLQAEGGFPCPYGSKGDRLYVKEALVKGKVKHITGEWAYYQADNTGVFLPNALEWVWKRSYLPSMFMPKIASRIMLEVTNVRVERLQEISVEDARAEGCDKVQCDCGECIDSTERGTYQDLWQSINAKKYPWASNPWCWVLEFRKEKP